MAYESQYNLRVLINDLVRMGSWDLDGEHGLSFYVENPESKFIFDCGHTGQHGISLIGLLTGIFV